MPCLGVRTVAVGSGDIVIDSIWKLVALNKSKNMLLITDTDIIENTLSQMIDKTCGKGNNNDVTNIIQRSGQYYHRPSALLPEKELSELIHKYRRYGEIPIELDLTFTGRKK